MRPPAPVSHLHAMVQRLHHDQRVPSDHHLNRLKLRPQLGSVLSVASLIQFRRTLILEQQTYILLCHLVWLVVLSPVLLRYSKQRSRVPTNELFHLRQQVQLHLCQLGQSQLMEDEATCLSRHHRRSRPVVRALLCRDLIPARPSLAPVAPSQTTPLYCLVRCAVLLFYPRACPLQSTRLLSQPNGQTLQDQ